MPLFNFESMLRLTGSARQNLSVSSGDFVSVTVLKQLGPDKWAVGIKGKVFPAISTVPLSSGATIFAQVQMQGKTIILKLANEMPQQSQLAQAQLEQAKLAMGKLGLPHDPVTLLVVSNMMKSSLPIDEKLVLKIRHALLQMKGDREKNARILALCVEKGISPESPGIQELAGLIDQDAGSGGRKDRKKKDGYRNSNNSEQKELKNDSMQPGEKSISMPVLGTEDISLTDISPLSVFNHLRGYDGNWVVVPFETNLSGKAQKGNMRVLYDVYSRKIRRIVIAPDGMNEGKIFFVLEPATKGLHCSIFTNEKVRKKLSQVQIDEFKSKMSNLGVKIDDIIHEDVFFDGFNQEIEHNNLQSIDTQG
ncbi:MAG: hypothetical protein EHM28_04915 [Spirochaetaceae bacterium]|nr:MAG: hypothetical protein EHM28_04915 [Spirochaetaceae bacterium]